MKILRSNTCKFLLFSILLFFIGCDNFELPNNNNTEIIGPTFIIGPFYNKQDQSLYLDVLSTAGINYKITEKGDLKYSLKDMAQVLSIQRKILYGEKINPNVEENIIVISQYGRNLYKTALNEAGIPFRLNQINGDSKAWSINYSQYYGPKVDHIRQDVQFKIHEHYRQAK